MARKRNCAEDEHRPNTNGKHRKKTKEGAFASHKKKQTSLLSFWGKPATTTVRPKTCGKSKSVDHEKASRSPAKKKKSCPNPEESLIVTPSSKQEPKKDTESSKTKNTNDKKNRRNGNDRNETSMERNTDDKEIEHLAPNEDSNTGNSIPMTSTLVEEAPSVAITPCKSPGSSQAESNEDATSHEETGSVTPTASKHHQDTANQTTTSADDDDNDDESSSNDPPASPQTSTSPRPRPPHALSDYEKLRLRNIERNNARLAALGLLTTASTLPAKRRSRPPRKRPKIHQPPTRQQPLRRSTRHRNLQPQTAGDASEVDATNGSPPETMQDRPEVEEEEEEEEEERYTASPLLQYEMSRAKKSDKDLAVTNLNLNLNSNSESSPSSSNNICLRVTGPRFVPPKGLNAIYSLEFWRTSGGADADASSSVASSNAESNWLVGAGKAGMIALWDTNAATEPRKDIDDAEEEEGLVDPILSWKAHSGRWIADAKFLPHRSTVTSASTSTSTRVATPSNLLTAGNDGTVCLWDLSAVSSVSGAPKLMHRTGKSYHSSGIFCMDISSDKNRSERMVCTGSKDKSIGVSSLDSLLQGTGEPSWRSRFHTAKVGAVNLKGKGSTLVASASDDGVVALHDIRTPSRGSESSLVAQLQDAHDRPHSVVWDTHHNTDEDEFVFGTAGLDPIVKLWDQRNLSQPLACLQGHVPTSTSRCKRIHRPVFFDPYYYSPTRNSENPLGCSSPFLLTGGQGSSSVSVYKLGSNLQQKQQQYTAPLVSRGKLPEDCGDSGCIAVNGKQVAVTVEEGEILILEPSFSAQ